MTEKRPSGRWIWISDEEREELRDVASAVYNDFENVPSEEFLRSLADREGLSEEEAERTADLIDSALDRYDTAGLSESAYSAELSALAKLRNPGGPE